ncbi:MAG: chromate transporter, partial [Chitinophagaceae bacterium]
FVGCGVLYMYIKSPPAWIQKNKKGIILTGIGFWHFEWGVLGKIALFFAKAGAFVFGSGLAIVPFLHSGVVVENKWLTEQEFLDAVAGFPGACVAALATFLPCYLLTILPAPYFKKISKNNSVKAFVDGITAAVIGALAGAVCIIAIRSLVDIQTLLIAMASLAALIYLKKIQEPWIILIAAIAGLLLKLVVGNA